MEQSVQDEFLENLQKQQEKYQTLKLLVEKINNVAPQLAKIWNPSLKAMILRQKIHAFFKNHSLECCKNCNGQCCFQNTFMSFKPEELLYFSIIKQKNGKKFELPEPDWQHIRNQPRHGEYANAHYFPPYCFFHSKKGCLLKQYRPIICMNYLCARMPENIGIELKNTGLRDSLDTEMRELRNEINSLNFNLTIFLASGCHINLKEVFSNVSVGALLHN